MDLLWDVSAKTALVLALLYGVLWALRRYSGRPLLARRGPSLSVVHTTHLGPGRSVHLMAVGEKLLLVGATSHNISLLAELNPGETDALLETAEEPAPFDRYLRQAMDAAGSVTARIRGRGQSSGSPGSGETGSQA